MNKINEVINLLVEQEISAQGINVYVDMDGVIAAFDQGVEKGTRHPQLKKTFDNLIAQFPDLAELPDDELKKQLSGPQADPGLKALKKAWQNLRQEKFAVAGRQGFFLGLPVMSGAPEMVSTITALTGKKPVVLTAPVDGDPARCEEEKRQWIEKNFPGMFSGFVCTQNKHEYANASSLLIDDRTKYTSKFQSAGGMVILHKNPQDTIEKLKKILFDRGLTG
jgi:hypothetical protein